MKRIYLSVVLFLLGISLAWPASAGYYDDLGQTYAIQNRKYNLKNEISLLVGFLPLDAFEKGVSLGGSYIYHYNDFLGFQIVNFHYVFGIDTGLKKTLINDFAVTPTEFDELQWYATFAVLLKPFYGKLISFNKHIIHGDIGVTLGAGAVNFKESVTGAAVQETKYRFALDLGLVSRIFLTQSLSLRFDIRNYVYFKGSDVGDILDLGLGLSFNFPTGSGKKKEATKKK